MLELKHELCDRVVFHDTVIVCAPKALEKSMTDGKEGHVLDIRVMLDAVGDNVVYIVVLLPPAARQASDEIGYENSDAAVYLKVMCDTHVPCVMDGENKLVPQ